jgi:hypothetical protein
MPYRACVALLLGCILLFDAAPLWAALELAYFRAAATNNSTLILEWATVRETNVNGFEILVKRSQEADSAYHPLGSRSALGTPQTGATYSFDVTSGLIAGERYCFRLHEVSSDDTPGENFDLCGFGIGLNDNEMFLPVLGSWQ